jgi:hypothetical protein
MKTCRRRRTTWWNASGAKLIAAALFQRKRLCGVGRFFGANSPILYHASHIDLTQEIVRLYDQAYAAKGGTPATKPAAAGQKPAPTVPGVKPE